MRFFLKIWPLFLSCFFCVVISSAQNTFISGTAPGAEGKDLRITTPGDRLTFTEKLLGQVEIDGMGNFSIALELNKPTDATLSVHFHTAEMILEPGANYLLEIGAMNYDDVTESDPFLQAQNLQVAILKPVPCGLNQQIGRFDSVYNSFLLDHFNAIYRDKKKNRIDSLRAILNREFGTIDNPFFVNYTTYKLASLEQSSFYYNTAQIARKYLIDKPVLYENPEYMDFFNNFFSKYISVTSIPLHKIDFRPLFRKPDPEKVLMNALATDTLLKNDQLRELVLLKGLMEWYSMPGFETSDILAVIHTIQKTSVYSENRVVATNLIVFLTRLKPGGEAPAFTLQDRNQNEISLKDFKGKPVLLCFWTTWCDECLIEMDFLAPLYEKYKGKIRFLSISADKYFSKMLLFINMKKDCTWDFAHIGDRMETLVDYDVRSYPLYVLIDSEGKIFRYPAGSPGRDLEAEIQQIIKE